MGKKRAIARVVCSVGVVLILVALAAFFCRRYGVPSGLLQSEAYDLENPVYGFVGQVFGYSATHRTKQGRIRYRMHARFRPGFLNLIKKGFAWDKMHLLIDADFYNARGERISTIRGGNGVSVIVSDSDLSSQIVSYVGGIQCGVCVLTYGSGRLRLLRYYDNNGLPDGPIVGYYENGARRFEGAFQHGVPRGDWRGWSEDGQEDVRPEDHPAIKAFRHRFTPNDASPE